MKRILSLLIVFALAACFSAQAASDPLLYRVSDESGHCVYLLGTIHFGSKGMYPLSDAVMDALAQSEALALEIDISRELTPEEAAIVQDCYFYPPGDGLSRHISPEIIRKAEKKLGAGPGELESLRPFYLQYLLEEKMSLLSREYGVENHLVALARERSMPVLAMEDFAAHLSVFKQAPDSIVEYSLGAMLGSRLTGGVMKVEMSLLSRLWASGREDMLASLLVLDPDVFPPALRKDAAEYARLIDLDRTEIMCSRAEEFLREGRTVFIAVGTAHVLSDHGMAALLAARGYAVEKLAPRERSSLFALFGV